MTTDPTLVRALALHAALTTVAPRYALTWAARYEAMLREYAETGDCEALHPEPEGEPEPGPLEAIKAAERGL